jgi:hypothetical protein
MRIKSELQGVYPQVEIYDHKKRKRLFKALRKIFKISISLKRKRGQ